MKLKTPLQIRRFFGFRWIIRSKPVPILSSLEFTQLSPSGSSGINHKLRSSPNGSTNHSKVRKKRRRSHQNAPRLGLKRRANRLRYC